MPGHSENIAWLLAIAGTLAVVSSLLLGVGGWLLVDGMMSGASGIIRSASEVVDDVEVATDAALVGISSVQAVVEDIESTARSSARTLGTTEELLADISDRSVPDVAETIEGAVQAMPGIIQTGRVIDRTLNALSLVGVDYDPEVPLDQALESLRDSLAPLPQEIRDQGVLLDAAARDLSEIGEDAGSLAASLLEVRIDLLEAEDSITATASNLEEVAGFFTELGAEFETFRSWAPWLPVAAAVALAASGAGILALGVSELKALGYPRRALSAGDRPDPPQQ